MTSLLSRRVAGVVAVALGCACASSATPPSETTDGCTKDTDCRDGRICDAASRVCVDRSGGGGGTSAAGRSGAAGTTGGAATGGSGAGGTATGGTGGSQAFGGGGMTAGAGGDPAGAAGVAGASGKAGSGGQTCPNAPAGSPCSYFPACGCKPTETCLPTTGGKAACFAAGSTTPGAGCTQSSDCAPGSDCVGGACLPFCGDSSDCSLSAFDRGCLALTSNGVPIPGASVCSFACRADTYGSCPTPTTPATCESPPSPSPYCAAAERVGCSPYKATECAGKICPTLPSGVACAVSFPSCFCTGGKTCTTAKGTGPSCTTPGTSKVGASCTLASECEVGAQCAGSVCRKVCNVSADCTPPFSCHDVTDGGKPVPLARVCLP